jgi:hypothetical protein
MLSWLQALRANSFNLQLFHLPIKENPQCLESREEQPVETGGKKL